MATEPNQGLSEQGEMTTEGARKVPRELRLEIAHVLFIDIVGYSKLLIDEQSEAMEELNQIVRKTEAAREAEAAGKLIYLPTGDGMALVFTGSVEEPVECALDISQALRAQPSLPLRMGIHSGPVHHVSDVNNRENIAGAGINIAQRVMDCGDAGHILVSKRVADDLAQYRRWQPYLHELGDFEMKHGVVVSVVNLYADIVGNPAPPGKFKTTPSVADKSVRHGAGGGTASQRTAIIGSIALALVALVIAGIFFLRNRAPEKATGIQPAAASPTAAAPASPSELTAVSDKSIAVLPFENLSDDKQNAYFTDGVQDEILADLAKIADLKVISRTSVMQYKSGARRDLRAIAAQLGVANILEGSVQRAGNKVRVTAQLINARTDVHLWAEKYDRPLDDVFAIQSDIAQAIASQLQAKLSPQEKSAVNTRPTSDLQAYDLYLRAQALYADTSDPIHARDKLPQADRILHEALERDPKFLLGWCLLARVHTGLYWYGIDHTPAELEKANAAVKGAIRLQPDAGETHLAVADYRYHGFRDYEGARHELDLARQTLPNNAELYEYTGYIDRREGHWPEATHNLGRALELDPRNFFTLQQMGQIYQLSHRYPEEAALFDRSLAVIPGDPATRVGIATLEIDAHADVKPYQTMLQAVIAEDPGVAGDVDDPNYSLCERTAAAAARTLANSPREGVATNGTILPHAYWEGVVARWQHDAPRAQSAFASARADLQKVVETQPDLAIAVSFLGVMDAGLGRKEEAIREGRRACELLPIEKDAIDGVFIAANLAQILAWTGEKAAAIEQLAKVESVPNQVSYGLLKLEPVWDELRGDPRFEKLVAEVATKQF
jgi:TolB-like protein/class 3 adenylate cyclase/Tfp pilus assembly protein PilF